MKKTAFIAVLLMLGILMGCREDGRFNAMLDSADSLMNTHPDSAFALLQSQADSITHLPQSQQMRYHLLTAKAQNKAYVNFTTDSLMLLVADYYDHHGTPNERMMAHYLLGCCYRDMGEAPATIQCYKDAVNLADTTRKDCDFRTMMSIYGQMATLYDKQAMPMEELEALERSGWYALKCGDTLNYIRSIQLQTHPYDLLQETWRIFEVTNQARDLYLKHGYEKEAAAALALSIVKNVEAKQYEKAHSLMQIYEQKSGRFDENGNIQTRYSNYYATKGWYYLGIHKIDSAEIYFRRLLSISGNSRESFKGLEVVYSELQIADSVIFYGKLAEEALNLMFTEISAQSVRQAESMYDYTRNQRIAHDKELEASKSRTFMFGVSFVCFSLLAATYLFYRRQKKQKELQVKTAMQEVMDLTVLYERSKEDARLAKHNLADFESYKQKEVEELKVQLELARQSVNGIDQKAKFKALLDSKIVTAFKNMTIPRPKQKLPTEKQWSELSNAVMSALPYFYERISVEDLLTCQEYRITLLTRLELTVGQVSVLLDTTSQRVTNAKRSANHKLFGEDSAQTFAENITKI